MAKYFSITLLFTAGLLLCSFIAVKDPQVKVIDQQVKQIIAGKKQGRYAVETLDQMSPTGGAVTGYADGKRLVLIETIFGGEAGFHALDLYFHKDSLIYAVEETIELQETQENQVYYDYVKKHTDANGDLDMSQWPKSVQTENRYYFRNNRVIGTRSTSFGKKIQLAAEEIAAKGSMVVLQAATHREELQH